MSAKMAEMKPHMDRLTKLHGKDKKKLQEEQMKLYKEMGVNPASGCLLAIIQMPIFISLYRVLTLFTTTKGAHIIENINNFAYAPYLKVTALNPHFFGINLWIMPSQFNQYGYFYLLIPVITGAMQYFQVSLSTPPTPPALAQTSEKDKKGNPEDMQKAMMTQMKYIFPIMIGYFSFTLPVGLSLYWNIFSLFSIIQYVMYNKKLKALSTDAKLQK
jgi:YidC/Oxa1 family membrane protein insertase